VSVRVERGFKKKIERKKEAEREVRASA